VVPVLSLAGYTPGQELLGAYLAGVAMPHQLHVLVDGLWDACRGAVGRLR